MTQRDDLVSRLRDESVRLSWNSIERGCVDSGIASNVADDAIDMLTDDATAPEANDAEIARLAKALKETEERHQSLLTNINRRSRQELLHLLRMRALPPLSERLSTNISEITSFRRGNGTRSIVL